MTDTLDRLQALTASLSDAVTPEQAAQVILTQTAAALAACGGVVARLTEYGNELISLHETGDTTAVVPALKCFCTDARLPLPDAVSSREPGVAVVALPLIVQGETIGGLGLRFSPERMFSDEERAFLRIVAGLCAQALDRARQVKFLAALANELLHMLFPVLAGLKLLRGDDRVREKAQLMAERQSAEITRLLQDLCDVSRISRGRFGLLRERVELTKAVQRAVETTRPLFEESAQQLEIRLPPEPAWLNADATRLAQVFANLLTNAAKYTDRGGHVQLTAERSGGEVVVSVKDTGIGIAPEHLPDLFEPFPHVAFWGKLCIGLSLVKGLVEMHGGSVTARSEGTGKGSEFVVRLPLVAGPP
jgi:signal transduction histidine kinase